MNTVRTPSIQHRLAIAGSVIVLCTLAILLVAVVRTSTTEVSSTDTTADVEETTEEPIPIAVAWTAAVVAAAALASMWWWAAQAVRPIQAVADAADSIQSESLDQRIQVDDAPRELHGLIDSFNAMLQRLEAAHIQQRELIEDTSHEIRTPLAAVALSLELAANDPETTAEAHRRNAQEALSLVEQLNTTVADLLDAARRHNHDASNAHADLAAVAKVVLDRHRLLTPDVRLQLTHPPQAFVPLRPQEVERALDNLIANAVNASSPGDTVSVSVTVQGGATTVSIEDAGPGIPIDQQERVFDRYETGGDGTGIGLAVVKAIADSSGSIAVHSPLSNGRGTRFEWTINLD